MSLVFCNRPTRNGGNVNLFHLKMEELENIIAAKVTADGQPYFLRNIMNHAGSVLCYVARVCLLYSFEMMGALFSLRFYLFISIQIAISVRIGAPTRKR